MSPEIGLVDANLRAAMRCYSRASAAGETRDFPGISLVSTGLDAGVFNSAMLTQPVETSADIDRRLHLAKLYFAARGLSWSLWLCEDLLSRSVKHHMSKAIRELGLYKVAEPPGMFLADLGPPGRPAPPMVVREVEQDRVRFDFVNLAATIFSLPYRVSQSIYGPESTWSAGMDGFVGYFEGQAVSVITTVSAAGSTGVYSLGTLPQCQGRGFGELMVRHALECAGRKHGAGPSVLQSTRSGLRLYKKLGYKVVGSFSVYLFETCGTADDLQNF